MINRRRFLGAALAAGAMPLFARAQSAHTYAFKSVTDLGPSMAYGVPVQPPVNSPGQRVDLYCVGSGLTAVPNQGERFVGTCGTDLGVLDNQPFYFNAWNCGTVKVPALELFGWDHNISAKGTYFESLWCGYTITTAPVFHQYTEHKLDAMLAFAQTKYAASDFRRLIACGNSMGAWGQFGYALRRPDQFAAVWVTQPRIINTSYADYLAATNKYVPASGLTIWETGEDYETHYNALLLAQSGARLPPIFWSIGKADGYSSWVSQMAFMDALKARTDVPFAVAWSDTAHGSASISRFAAVSATYNKNWFAVGKGLPVFRDSTLDTPYGVKGDGMSGGINLGFQWKNSAGVLGSVDESVNGFTCWITNTIGPVSVTVRPRSSVFDTSPAQPLTVTIPAAGQWVPVRW